MNRKHIADVTNLACYASMPVTPLGELDQWANTDKVVRLRVKMLGQPLLTDSAGEKLAYKSVVQSSEDDGVTYVDASWWIPASMEAGDGKTRVTLDTQHKTLDHAFITERLHGQIRDHKIPPDIAALTAPDFEEVEVKDGYDITIYTLSKSEMVTVFGVVEKKDGHFVIQPPKRSFSTALIVSPYDDGRLNRDLKAGVVELRIAAAFIFATLFVILGLAAICRQRERREKDKNAAPQSPDAWNS